MVVATFIPLDSRRFVTLDAEAGDGEHGLTWPEVWDGGLEGAFVKLRYTATAEQARRIDHTAVRQALLDAGAFNVWIEPQIEHELRARVQGLDDSVSDTEALTLWLDSQSVNGAQAPALHEKHADYLQEVGS